MGSNPILCFMGHWTSGLSYHPFTVATRVRLSYALLMRKLIFKDTNSKLFLTIILFQVDIKMIFVSCIWLCGLTVMIPDCLSGDEVSTTSRVVLAGCPSLVDGAGLENQ